MQQMTSSEAHRIVRRDVWINRLVLGFLSMGWILLLASPVIPWLH